MTTQYIKWQNLFFLLSGKGFLKETFTSALELQKGKFTIFLQKNPFAQFQLKLPEIIKLTLNCSMSR